MSVSKHDKWNALIQQARNTNPPPVDATSSVLAYIRNAQVEHETPLLWFAGATSVSAACVAVYLFSMVSVMTDPLSALFTLIPGGLL